MKLRQPTLKLPEYESKIAEKRIEKGFTLKTLSEKAGCSITQLHCLQLGLTAPISARTGKVKESAKKIANALDSDVYDLFPMYFCSAEKMKEKEDEKIRQAEMYGDSISEFTLYCSAGVERSFEELELNERIEKALNTLRPREAKIIKEIFGIGCDRKELSEIAKDQKCGRQNIFVIQCRALRKLRHPSRSNQLKYFYVQHKHEAE